MPSVVTKIEFFNGGVAPVEKMGEILNPAENFAVCFVDPPVHANYYADMYGIATFDNGSYSNSSASVETYLGITAKSLFDNPAIEYKTTELTSDLPMTLDLSFVTEFTIEAAAIAKFVLEYKKNGDVSWTSVDITSLTLSGNIFTNTYTLDITADEIYAIRVKAIDSNGDTTGYSETKYIIKNMYVAWDNAGTEALTWDNTGTDLVLY